MAKSDLSIEQTLALLTEAPRRIAEFTEGLSPVQMRARLSADDWSINDILAHLRACADMWGDGIARILAEDDPTFRAINPTTWIERTDYPDLAFRPSFQAFAAQRAGLLTVLEALSPEEWARSGTVTGAGKPLTRTVRSFAERLVVHERAPSKRSGGRRARFGRSAGRRGIAR